MSPIVVLIVEDNVAQAESLSLCLKLEGWTVHVAQNGLAAPQVAEMHTPDVVILDWRMPGLPGQQFLDWLRGRPETVRVPVVVTTGLPIEEVADLVNRDTRTAVLQKPFEVKTLIRIVETLIARGRDSGGDVPAQPSDSGGADRAG